ncbi:MAG: hypothetical protein ACOX83_07190 [Candidatus Spyradocola sp.]|jgi:hypothetical protein
MLYPENQKPALDETTFQNPPSEYRAAPFWAWNCDLNEDLLLREIEQMKAMGMGGFHMHVRTGMSTTYLSDEFMQLIRACTEKAKKEKMLAYLYDEDRWPSGAAGGYVTREEKFRARHLLFTPVPYEEDDSEHVALDSSARASRKGNGTLLARYAVRLNSAGELAAYRRLAPGEKAGAEETTWYAYLEHATESPWYNNQTYVNTLDKAAIERFVQITHERYKEVVGDEFGGVVPSIFTDEPQFTRKTTLGFAGEKKDVVLPWTDDLPKTYEEAYGESLLNHLPEFFWELPEGKVSRTRYRYHDHIAERFASAFADTCGTWCRENGILLTGHMMEEPTLHSQTAALGEAMRSYRSFGLPGIDMLCDWREYTTAKQAQSASRQFGCPGVLSELYGVTNWDFDFRGHKLAGDWQAALGVTTRVPHLTWVSMAGEAKRDYPASIGYQSPWYKEYPLIEDHFARVNSVLTRGKAQVRLGVIHPVESYWLHWGPEEQTALVREEMDKRFQDLADWLLFGLIDFDYISESLLPLQCKAGSAPLHVGCMQYDIVLVPACETLRSTTVERLEAFVDAGGKLLFAGQIPTLVDAQPSDRVQALAARASVTGFSRGEILSQVEAARFLDVRDDRGARTNHLLHQVRAEGETRYVFLCNGRKPQNPDVCPRQELVVRIQGEWKVDLLDTATGEIAPLAVSYVDGKTVLSRALYAYDSLLLRLNPGRREEGKIQAPEEDFAYTTIRKPVPVTLSEPNVLLLDTAEYAFDDGPWQAEEELLRADNAFRAALSWPSRKDHVAQPWVVPDEPIVHKIRLRFTVRSEIEIRAPRLALEDAERVGITVNGKAVESRVVGWFVDESIRTVQLPDLPAGESAIELSIPFGRRTNVEWCYLLGDFGVRVAGAEKTVTPPVWSLGFGDWTNQGLPFYCGNVTYRIPVEVSGTSFQVRVPQYRGAVLGMEMDGKRAGDLAYAPYAFRFDGLTPGRHELGITVYGSRVNGFGCVHNCDDSLTWFGPDCWRSEGIRWCYEYRLRKMGLLVSPQIETP